MRQKKLLLQNYLQHISDDANTPHICGKANFIVVDHFRGDEFRCTKHDLDTVTRFENPCQAKINDFDSVGIFRNAEDVLRLQVKVKDGRGMHVGYSITDLSQKVYAVSFCQDKVFTNDTLKQLTSSNTKREREIGR